MPYFQPEELDIDVEEFVDSCSKSEIKELIDYLISEEFVSRNSAISAPRNMTLRQQEFNEATIKIEQNYHRLTVEEEQLIIQISKRF